MIDIKDISGTVRYSTPINVGSKRVYSLMTSDYITLKFSLAEPINFKLGDFIDDERFGLFELVDKYTPTYNASTGGYDYELRLDAYYWKWKNKIFKYTPEHAGYEASWSLTATLDVQLGVFLRNLKALGYTYKGTDFTFDIDDTVANKAIAMTYDNINLLDALFLMAGKDKWNCDCWITDNVIHFGRCEIGDAVNIEIGVQAAPMSRSQSKGTYATRIYAFGSKRNIPSNYRPVEEQAVVNGIVQKRLMLPAGTPYIDAYPGLSQEEAIEDIVVFDDVFPRRVGTMSDVHTRTDTVTNEDGTESTYIYYRYKDTGLTFKNSYILEGQELRIVFQSGNLNGMEFGVIFNPEPKDTSRGEQLWEIVANENYGRLLPDDIMYPENGDEYILSGFDIQMVSDQYIPAAEQELKERAQAYVDKAKIDDGTYTVQLYSSWVAEDPLSRVFGIGQKINLINPSYFENGRVSRVIGYEFNLDYPYDSPIYTIGESAQYSRIGALEDKVDSLTYKGETYTGSGNSIYVIKRNDSTPPSDWNVYSSLRSIMEFLSKRKDDSAAGRITFLKGAQFGKDFASGITGVGGFIDSEGSAELDSLTLRKYLKTPELRKNKVTAVYDEFWFTDAGTIDSVKPGNTILLLDENRNILKDANGTSLILQVPAGYIVSFRQEKEDEMQPFQQNDILMGKYHTDTGFQTVYFRVLYTLNDTTVFIVPINGVVPEEAMTLVRIGNYTQPDRQNSIYISGSEGYMRILSGVNSTEIKIENIRAQYGNLNGLSIDGFGALSGFGEYSDNAYKKGVFLMKSSGESVEDFIENAINSLEGKFSDWVFDDSIKEAMEGESLIVGGYFNTQLIQTDELRVGNSSTGKTLIKNGKIDTELLNAQEITSEVLTTENIKSVKIETENIIIKNGAHIGALTVDSENLSGAEISGLREIRAIYGINATPPESGIICPMYLYHTYNGSPDIIAMLHGNINYNAGNFNGFRAGYKKVTANYTIKGYDNIIFCYNTADITIFLDSSAVGIGQEIFIKKVNTSGQVKIQDSLGRNNIHNVPGSMYNAITLTGDFAAAHFLWDGDWWHIEKVSRL